MNEYNMGGLIPDPSYDLRRRIEKLEARLAEMLELEKPNPIRWGELVGEKTAEALRSLGWGHPNEIQHLKARIAELEKDMLELEKQNEPEPKTDVNWQERRTQKMPKITLIQDRVNTDMCRVFGKHPEHNFTYLICLIQVDMVKILFGQNIADHWFNEKYPIEDRITITLTAEPAKED